METIMRRFLLTTALALVLIMPLTGCIPMLAGYLIAKAVEGPATTTSSCNKNTDGTQTCTTVSTGGL